MRRYALVIYPSLVYHFANKQLQSILPKELVVITILRVCSLGPRGHEFSPCTGGFGGGINRRRGRRWGLCKSDETLLESKSFWTFGEHFDAPNLEDLTRPYSVQLVASRQLAISPAARFSISASVPTFLMRPRAFPKVLPHPQ